MLELYTNFFFFLGSLLCKECSENFLEYFSIGLTYRGTGSASLSGFVGLCDFSLIEGSDLCESNPFAPDQCKATFRV